ncbi:MAG: hypothetical protein PHC66_02065 [Candidatus Nanoarchaeia archaeon]|nr:hypothetical protein [Candidatus Nanoarchaeia archaeon]MDD5239739.1 hypothetical protein [Candidatus Nanoarchaeia archaeon]
MEANIPGHDHLGGLPSRTEVLKLKANEAAIKRASESQAKEVKKQKQKITQYKQAMSFINERLDAYKSSGNTQNDYLRDLLLNIKSNINVITDIEGKESAKKYTLDIVPYLKNALETQRNGALSDIVSSVDISIERMRNILYLVNESKLEELKLNVEEKAKHAKKNINLINQKLDFVDELVDTYIYLTDGKCPSIKEEKYAIHKTLLEGSLSLLSSTDVLAREAGNLIYDITVMNPTPKNPKIKATYLERFGQRLEEYTASRIPKPKQTLELAQTKAYFDGEDDETITDKDETKRNTKNRKPIDTLETALLDESDNDIDYNEDEIPADMPYAEDEDAAMEVALQHLAPPEMINLLRTCPGFKEFYYKVGCDDTYGVVALVNTKLTGWYTSIEKTTDVKDLV